jgi:hypothetical protein
MIQNLNKKQKIKNHLTIRLDREITNRKELNNIIKILDNRLLVECFKVIKRYPACATLEVSADKCKANIEIKSNFILIAGYYYEFNKEIYKRLIEILEV